MPGEMSRHSKCMNGLGCIGPGCRVTNYHVNVCAPRKRTTPTKAERKLAVRRDIYDDHGRQPPMMKNPSNGNGPGHWMIRPGSQNLR